MGYFPHEKKKKKKKNNGTMTYTVRSMCINIISCIVLLKIMKLNVMRMLFFPYNPLTKLLAYISGKLEGGVIPGKILKA